MSTTECTATRTYVEVGEPNGVPHLVEADRFYVVERRNCPSSSILRASSAANKLAQRGAGAMDMQDLLGLGSGDFEDVEFAASSESEGEEEPAASSAARVVPRSNTTTSGNGAEISNVENTTAAAAAAGPSPAAMETTTILQVWSMDLLEGPEWPLCASELNRTFVFASANARKVSISLVLRVKRTYTRYETTSCCVFFHH